MIQHLPFGLLAITGAVVPGTGSASGARIFGDIGGSVNAQRPYFEHAGVNMSDLYIGTINLDVYPDQVKVVNPDYVVRDVKWHPDMPAETFSLTEVIVLENGVPYRGLTYLPHPETKPWAFPGYGMIEVLAPLIPGLSYGDVVTVLIPEDKVEVTRVGG